MKYMAGDSVVEYSVYRKGDACPEILSLLFSVGDADQVLYIEHLELVNSNVRTALDVMKEFISNFDGQSCIAYSVKSGTDVMSVLMRYVIQQIGFVSTGREIDSPSETLFILRNVESYSVMQKLEDELFSFVFSEMINDTDKTRINLLLSRIGNEDANKLKQYLNFSSAQTATPQKVVI